MSVSINRPSAQPSDSNCDMVPLKDPVFDLHSYHCQNQMFLEEANARREPLTLEELVELERLRLTKTPAHQFAQQEAKSQLVKSMTPSFIFRLSQSHPHAPPPSNGIPMRKHQLEPIIGDDEWSCSEAGILSNRDTYSASSSGIWSARDFSNVLQDMRDDEKYISSPDSSDMTKQVSQDSTQAYAVVRDSPSEEEDRDKQASSDDQLHEDTIQEPRIASHRIIQKKESPEKGKRRQRKYRERKELFYYQRYVRELEYDRQLIMAQWKLYYDNDNVDQNDNLEPTNGFCSSLCLQCVDPCIAMIKDFFTCISTDESYYSLLGQDRIYYGSSSHLLPSRMDRGEQDSYGSVESRKWVMPSVGMSGL